MIALNSSIAGTVNLAVLKIRGRDMNAGTPQQDAVIHTCALCGEDFSHEQQFCRACGMPLVIKRRPRRVFWRWFWAIAIFCVVMMLVLPRGGL